MRAAPPHRCLAVAVGVAAISTILLAGCAGQNPVVENYRGEPKGVEPPASSAGGAPWAAWADSGRQFSLTLYGSSTCPPVGTDLIVRSGNRVRVIVPASTTKRCTKDYVPHTTIFHTPSDLDPSKDATITAQAIRFSLPAFRP